MHEEKTPRWAKIDENGVVVRTIIASRARIQSGKEGNPDEWMEYTDGLGDGMRGPCGVGMTYSTDMDQFIIDSPYPSWVLNANTMEWEAPVEKPQDVDDGDVPLEEDDKEMLLDMLDELSDEKLEQFCKAFDGKFVGPGSVSDRIQTVSHQKFINDWHSKQKLSKKDLNG